MERRFPRLLLSRGLMLSRGLLPLHQDPGVPLTQSRLGLESDNRWGLWSPPDDQESLSIFFTESLEHRLSLEGLLLEEYVCCFLPSLCCCCTSRLISCMALMRR